MRVTYRNVRVSFVELRRGRYQHKDHQVRCGKVRSWRICATFARWKGAAAFRSVVETKLKPRRLKLEAVKIGCPKMGDLVDFHINLDVLNAMRSPDRAAHHAVIAGILETYPEQNLLFAIQVYEKIDPGSLNALTTGSPLKICDLNIAGPQPRYSSWHQAVDALTQAAPRLRLVEQREAEDAGKLKALRAAARAGVGALDRGESGSDGVPLAWPPPANEVR